MTPSDLARILSCPVERAERFCGPLNEAMARYAIDTFARQTAFLAQIGHESGRLRYVRELASGQAYEGRADLGNTQPGDGVRFKGRGLIQITGRENYRKCGDALDVDLIASPELLETPQLAALSAGWFWDWKGLNALADAGDFERITRRINGGLNGYDDRLAIYAKAKEVLAEQNAAQSIDPDTQPPAPVEDAAAPLAPLSLIQPEAPMALPFLIPAAQALIGIAPDLIRIFGSGSQISERNAKVAELVVEKAKEVTGAMSGEEAVTKLQADPRLAEQFRMSVREQQDAWLGMVVKLSELEEGSRAKAREFSLQQNDPVVGRFTFVQLLTLIVVFIAAGFGGFVMASDSLSTEVKSSVIMVFVGGFTAAIAFWLGSSFGSMTKNPPTK